MLTLFRRAIANSAGRAASANLRAAANVLQALTEVGKEPKARKRSAAKPKTRKPKALKKPRKGLAETVAWIAAGGMPARPAATRRKAAVPVVSGEFCNIASWRGGHGKVAVFKRRPSQEVLP